VFEQQERIANLGGFAQFDQPLLQAQAGWVVDGAELEDGDQSLFAADFRGFSRIEN
jgi:hypothetical protein